MKSPRQAPAHQSRNAHDPIARTFTQHERFRGIHVRLLQQYPLGLKNPKLPFVREEELAREFLVTPRTIREDILRLQTRLHMPIRRFPERNGGFGYTQKVTHFPLDEFTGGEQKTMILALHAFDAWAGLPLHKKLPRIFTKLGTTAGAKVEVDPRHLKACVTFKAGGYQAPMNEEVFETVLDAVLQQRELRFPYLSLEVRRADAKLTLTNSQAAALHIASRSVPARRGSLITQLSSLNAPEIRHVQPLHLLCWQYAWYLFGWDYDRQDIRTFALGRMTSVEDTGRQFKPAVRFNLRKELQHSFGITRAKAPEHIHLRFVPEAIPLIVERLWHPTQKLTLNEADSSLDLTLDVAICPELIRWVASWRHDVQVLAPTSLDDMLIQSAAEFLQRAANRRGIAVKNLLSS